MFFSVITKNLNLEILTKNLVTFILLFSYFKIRYIGGRGGVSLKGGLGQFLRGLGKKEGGGVCLRGVVDTPMHTMIIEASNAMRCRFDSVEIIGFTFFL